MGKLFGTDGIRGEANRYPMDAGIAFSVGQAVPYLLKKPNHRIRIIIGKDTRIRSHALRHEGDARCGKHPHKVRVSPHRSNARLQSTFKHIT